MTKTRLSGEAGALPGRICTREGMDFREGKSAEQENQYDTIMINRKEMLTRLKKCKTTLLLCVPTVFFILYGSFFARKTEINTGLICMGLVAMLLHLARIFMCLTNPEVSEEENE